MLNISFAYQKRSHVHNIFQRCASSQTFTLIDHNMYELEFHYKAVLFFIQASSIFKK